MNYYIAIKLQGSFEDAIARTEAALKTEGIGIISRIDIQQTLKSKIDVDEGWLPLTHGVGAMRKYSICAVLLDKDDPSKILGRTSQPILSAADEDREGYVPNVVDSCGGMHVGDDIFLPYGVADSSVAFAFVAIPDLLDAM